MARSFHREIATEVAAPVARTWDVVAQVERWPELTPSMTSVRLLAGEPLALGSKVRIKQPRLLPAVWTVTEFEEWRSFAWVSKSVGITTVARHRLDPAGDNACLLTLSLDASGPLVRLFGPMVRRLSGRYVAMEANGLKRAAEAPPA